MPKRKLTNEPGIHFRKSADGKFYVVCIADNGEVLQQSEVLESKLNCLVNVQAMYKLFTSPSLDLIDETNGKKLKRQPLKEVLQ